MRRAARVRALCVASVLLLSTLPASAGDKVLTQEQRLQLLKALIQTGTNAMYLGEWVRIQDWSYPLPSTSKTLTMEADQKVDAWGNPFCIVQVGDRVAVVSGGPSQFSCDALPLSTKEIVESKTDVSAGYFITESKLVVYVIRRARNLRLWAD